MESADVARAQRLAAFDEQGMMARLASDFAEPTGPRACKLALPELDGSEEPETWKEIDVRPRKWVISDTDELRWGTKGDQVAATRALADCGLYWSAYRLGEYRSNSRLNKAILVGVVWFPPTWLVYPLSQRTENRNIRHALYNDLLARNERERQ